MNLLLLGATGLAGQAFGRAANARGITVHTVARKQADITCDISEGDTLASLLRDEAPDIVVNAAALINHAACEADPGLGWRTNARPAGILAEWSQRTGQPFLQISTDHYFTKGGNSPHAEDAPVVLLNEYAREKFAGEVLALTAPQALVLRTSIVGIRGHMEPSFAEWAIAAVEEDREMTLFADAWTSSLDTNTFADAALDLFIDHETRGLVNVASSEVYSKEAFIREIAKQSGQPLTRATSGSVHSVLANRASCLGLDVARAELILNRRLPDMTQVVASLLEQHRSRCK